GSADAPAGSKGWTRSPTSRCASPAEGAASARKATTAGGAATAGKTAARKANISGAADAADNVGTSIPAVAPDNEQDDQDPQGEESRSSQKRVSEALSRHARCGGRLRGGG